MKDEESEFQCPTCHRKGCYFYHNVGNPYGLDVETPITIPVFIERFGCTKHTKFDFVNTEWVIRYCEDEIKKEEESWNKYQRAKNDTWINASHSGQIHKLEEIKSLMETLKRIREIDDRKEKVPR